MIEEGPGLQDLFGESPLEGEAFSGELGEDAGASAAGDEAGEFVIELDAQGNPIPKPGADGGGDDEAEVVKIKRQDWDKFQTDLAELRGIVTATKGGTLAKTPPEDAAEALSEQPARQQQSAPQQTGNIEEQLDNLSGAILGDLTSGDETRARNAIKNVLKIGAQAGFNNARQLFGTMAPAQAQSIVDSYINRKAAKDPLYEKGVGDLFESLLDKYDTSVLVGQPRKVVMDTLDTMYQRAKGDWADKQYSDSQQRQQARAKQGDSNPPNLGGGKAGSTQTTGRTLKIPVAWVDWARRAGIPDEEMQSTFAVMNRRGDAA